MRSSGATSCATTALLALAYLAKPVAMLAIAPLIGLLWQRARAGRRTPLLPIALLVAAPVLVFWLYDRSVASYAEWHWASGITKLHVLPALSAALSGLPAFAEKLTNFRIVLGMLRDTMLGRRRFPALDRSLRRAPLDPGAQQGAYSGRGSRAACSTFSSS